MSSIFACLTVVAALGRKHTAGDKSLRAVVVGLPGMNPRPTCFADYPRPLFGARVGRACLSFEPLLDYKWAGMLSSWSGNLVWM